ncbi:hypothetical protein PDESU_02859 [Pontiella desulfatans]|uniref:Type II secretion system protein G n=2 Tax=Pontiella desulfatans TaxID=2750659 RepID=A0A6C2U2T9_PONDE|nr:hypothetical protein PDESU_02859 [Pontiella desulfatans]
MEIMISTSIIGLLASLALPSLNEAGKRARSKRFSHEIRTVAHAFMNYSIEEGGYPPDSTPGIMPKGMSSYLESFGWNEKTVIGGQWDWDHRVFGIRAAISVYGPDWNEDLMEKIDKTLDDGNLASGDFRKRSGGYMYIIEH